RRAAPSALAVAAAACAGRSTLHLAARLGMTVTRNQMIVDHADGLHEGVDDGRPAEFEAAPQQLLRHRARLRRLVGDLRARAEIVDLGLAVDEVPKELREPGPLFHDLEPRARGEHRAIDLGLVAHDAGILHQRRGLALAVARDLFGLEPIEGATEVVTLAQDRDPRQPGLKA